MNSDSCLESTSEVTCGTHRLFCRSARPTSATWARLLLIHGYGEHTGRYVRFMQFMANHGVACDAIDLRGHGKSSGRRGFVREWDEYLRDVEAFLGQHRQSASTEENLPVFLLGHSHGGLISAAAGERGILSAAGITGCVLASPYLATRVPPPVVKRLFAHAADKIVPWLRVRSNLKPEWLSSDPKMLAEDRADELMNHSATPRWFFTMRFAQVRTLNEATHFSLPLLCLAGEADVIADPSATSDFYARSASKDKSIYTYPDRLHELLREVGRDKVFADVLGWIKSRTIA